MSPTRFSQLALEYLHESERAFGLLQHGLGRTDVLKAWKLGQIPQAARLGTVQYEMHGLGCVIILPGDWQIDFDFANETEIGFDAWRLWRFAQRAAGRRREYEELAVIEQALAVARAAGVVNKAYPRWPGLGNSELYRLASHKSGCC